MEMKIIKQIQVNAAAFQKWVVASIPSLSVDVWEDKWELFVSNPLPLSPEMEVEEEWDVLMDAALQSDVVEVRHIATNGDIVGCRKNNETFHCFFMGDAERINSLEEMSKEVEENFTFDQWKELAQGINVD